MPLKIGVMIDSLEAPAWVEKIFADLAAADFVDIALVVRNPDKRETRLLRRLRILLPRFLFALYEKLDRALFSRGEHDAFAPSTLAPHLRGVETIEVSPLRRGFRQRFRPEVVRRIKDKRLDVMLRLGFGILSGDILDCAERGVWSLHHGDDREYRGGPAMFWEIHERSPASGVMLQILTEDLDGGKVLARSFSSTHPFSLFRSRNGAYWKSSDLIPRALRLLHRRGWTGLERLAARHAKADYRKPIYRTPGNFRMFSFLSRIAIRYASAKVTRAFWKERWFIAFRRRRADTADVDLGGSPFTLVPPEPGTFAADPFVVREGGAHHIFYEEGDLATGKGVIARLSVEPDGRFSSRRIVLARDYHLSYPMVFRWGGEHFMIPETRQNGTIELYRASRFPDEWKLEKVLFGGVQAADPTIVEHEGGLWLFVNMSVSGGPIYDELFAFHAHEPAGDWTPHPLNPIVSDVRRARPAGKLFRSGGRLYRPGQDNSARIGHAIELARVESLTPDDYRETPYRRLGPRWLPGNLATHTYNFDGDVEAVDGLRLETRL